MKLVSVDNKPSEHDLLAIFTNYTRLVLVLFSNLSQKVQRSYCYQLMLRTTQPAHLITLVSALILAKVLIPQEKTVEEDISPPPTIMKLIYLGSVSSHFGIQMWMTFVSGLALYLSLPRHTFGAVQQVLFPKYFTINAVLSLVTLSTFLKYTDEVFEDRLNIQIIALVICFCIELTIRLYMAPKLLELMMEKNIMETAAGVGTEVGRHHAGILAECPVYTQLYSSFRKVHMTIAIGNMITMACTVIHLHYLSDRISI